jgi:hypothetical protein
MTTQEKLAQAKKEVNRLKAELYQERKSIVTLVDKKAIRKQQKAVKYATKNGLTIHKLRLAGYDVSVSHIRYTEFDYDQTVHRTNARPPIRVPVPTHLREYVDFSSKGGATHIVISRPTADGGTTGLRLTSICHELDSFDYKLGVKTALDQIEPALAAQLLAPESTGIAVLTFEPVV